MTTAEPPVVAAVPNYNMGESLADLLPALLEQQYDDIFVLDDGSDDSSRDVAESFRPYVRFVQGGENAGAGANRNRILSVLGSTSIIHFVDADMELVSKDNPDKIRQLTRGRRYAFIGGMILEEEGVQYPFNFGPFINLRHKLTARRHFAITQLAKTDPDAARVLRARQEQLLSDWPDPLEENPQPRQVDWVTEGNLIIHSDVFKKLRGFDPDLRHHEIHDFAVRAKKLGLDGFFDPEIVTFHKNIDVRGSRRKTDAYKALWKLGRKHGFASMLSWR